MTPTNLANVEPMDHEYTRWRALRDDLNARGAWWFAFQMIIASFGMFTLYATASWMFTVVLFVCLEGSFLFTFIILILERHRVGRRRRHIALLERATSTITPNDIESLRWRDKLQISLRANKSHMRKDTLIMVSIGIVTSLMCGGPVGAMIGGICGIFLISGTLFSIIYWVLFPEADALKEFVAVARLTQKRGNMNDAPGALSLATRDGERQPGELTLSSPGGGLTHMA